MKKWFKKIVCAVVVLGVLIGGMLAITPSNSDAAMITLQLRATWNPNTEPDMAGYRFYHVNGTAYQWSTTLLAFQAPAVVCPLLPLTPTQLDFTKDIPDIPAIGTITFGLIAEDTNTNQSTRTDKVYSYNVDATAPLAPSNLQIYQKITKCLKCIKAVVRVKTKVLKIFVCISFLLIVGLGYVSGQTNEPIAHIQNVTAERPLLQPPTIYNQQPYILNGSVENVTSRLPNLSFPKKYRGETINYKRIETFNGWFANRIRLEDVLPELIKHSEHMWQREGWDPRLIRFEIYFKSSTQGFGLSLGSSASGSQNFSSAGVNGSTNGNLGFNTSITNPQFQIMLYEISEEYLK